MIVFLYSTLGLGIAVFLFLFVYFYRRCKDLRGELVRQKEVHKESTVKSLRGQRSAISGDDVAKFLPWAEEYFSVYNSRDVVMLGDVADYLVFVGKVNEDITEVVFQEVKMSRPDLSKAQASLKKCIEEGKVRWETWVFNRGTNSFGLRRGSGGSSREGLPWRPSIEYPRKEEVE